MSKYKERAAYKETTECWAPSYKLDDGTELVRVSCSGPNRSVEGNDYFMVSVWGGDDCGMEHDTEVPADALAMFIEILELETITFDALREIGLYSA